MKHLNTSARDSTVCGFLSLATSVLVAIPLGPSLNVNNQSILPLDKLKLQTEIPGTGGEQDLFLSRSAMISRSQTKISQFSQFLMKLKPSFVTTSLLCSCNRGFPLSPLSLHLSLFHRSGQSGGPGGRHTDFLSPDSRVTLTGHTNDWPCSLLTQRPITRSYIGKKQQLLQKILR